MEQNNWTEKLVSNFWKSKQLSQKEGFNSKEKTVAIEDVFKDCLKIN